MLPSSIRGSNKKDHLSLAQILICLIQINFKGPVIRLIKTKIITDKIPSSVTEQNELNADRPKMKFIIRVSTTTRSRHE